MDVEEKAKYESESQDLRLQLKTWENKWAKSHQGKKPGREDIKQNPDIAQKYKLYNKIRDILSGKIPLPKKSDDTSAKKRKAAAAAPVETPSKRARTTETPSKAQAFAEYTFAAAAGTPSISRKLFSPAVPTSIGPTPQRDGRVLGLFDILVGENAEATPCKVAGDANAGAGVNVQATPSKQIGAIVDQEDALGLGKTPTSSTRKRLFATPLKKRDANVNGQGALTPTSSLSLQFATPAFLRRVPLPPVDENGEYVSPRPLRLPRKPLVRGLSSVVAGLRKLEEERLDEELEALHEMENEASMPPKGPKKPIEPLGEDILAADSQARPLPLGGFDDEGRYDSLPEDALGADGKSLRVYKKKGQKRTTRFVNMRPVRTKRPATALEGTAAGEDEEHGGVVPETQPNNANPGVDENADGGEDALSGSEYGGGSDAEDEKTTSKSRAKAKKPEAKKPAAKEGTFKKAARKVNELAHANFRRLKLRNTGTKGGPAHNSRFRRRR